MQQVDVNFVPVLASGVIAMVLGYLWYSPMLFGKPWAKLLGMSVEKMQETMKQGMAKTYGLMFVSSLILAYVLAHVIAFAESTTVSEGVQGGLWVWLGFIATTMLNGVLFEKKPFKLFLLNSGYYLVLLLIIGGLLAVWR